MFIRNNQDTVLKPIKELSEIIQNDPQIQMMMQDPNFEREFQAAFTKNLAEKLNGSKIQSIEDFKSQI
jgi:F0F1-type ATP synthase delta subunit